MESLDLFKINAPYIRKAIQEIFVGTEIIFSETELSATVLDSTKAYVCTVGFLDYCVDWISWHGDIFGVNKNTIEFMNTLNISLNKIKEEKYRKEKCKQFCEKIYPELLINTHRFAM